MSQRIDIRPAREVLAREIPMLWRRRLPLGTLSLIAGRPGSGKSNLALLIAAEISQQGLVSILSNPEDDLETVVRPRLNAMGGNHSLIYLVGEDSLFTLPKDFTVLEDMIRDAGASFVVLDPIAAHFNPEGKVHSRLALRRLINIAKRTRCAILGIHHTVKTPNSLIEQIGGSMGGLVGSARAVYVFNPEGTGSVWNGRAFVQIDNQQDRWKLQCVKVNGLEEPGHLLFTRHVVEIDGIEAPKLQVVGHGFGIHPDQVAAAAEWLTKYLAADPDGVRLNGEVRTEGQKAGFSWTMLQTLALDLGFLSPNGTARWRLPDDHPLREKVQ